MCFVIRRNAKSKSCHGPAVHRFLFQKRLTATDTSQINRIVLPGISAVTHLPKLSDRSGGNAGHSLECFDVLTGACSWVSVGTRPACTHVTSTNARKNG